MNNKYEEAAKIIKEKINKITLKKIWYKKLIDLIYYCRERSCSDCIFGKKSKKDYYCCSLELNDPEEWEDTFIIHNDIIELIKILSPKDIKTISVDVIKNRDKYILV